MAAISSELQNLYPTVDIIETVYLIKVIISFILGGTIGFSYRKLHKNGIRIFGNVSLGSCAFSVIAIHLFYIYKVTYSFSILAGIVTGVGFLGAGLIFKDQTSSGIKGISAAATLWATAAVGLAIGSNMYIIGIGMTIIISASYLLHRD